MKLWTFGYCLQVSGSIPVWKNSPPEVVNKIIKRIEVHNIEVVDGHKRVKIDIYFTGAGLVDLATVKEMLAIAEAAQK